MPARSAPRTKIHLSIPTALKGDLDRLLEDPHAGSRRYGAISFLTTRLLQYWVNQQDPDTATVFPPLDPKELFREL